MERTVLKIDPKNSGFLVIKDGGSAEFVYACTDIDDVIALVKETYGTEPLPHEQRMLPPAIQAQIERAELEDSDPSLNNGGVVP